MNMTEYHKDAREQAAQVAEKAAELIAERGHCKGRYESADGSLCAVGALRTAQGIMKMWTAGLATQTLNRRVGIAAVTWNDWDSTTAEDVILELKRTAEELRA
jgi:hypothetical protein